MIPVNLPRRPRLQAAWRRTVDPAIEPVTVLEARQQSRITQINDDAMIARYITVAREACEDYTGRGLLTQTYELTLQRFAEEMFLPRACPLQNDDTATPSTAVIVQYYDATGTKQTLDPSRYDVDLASRPARIVRAANTAWPAVQADRTAGRVVITYVVGWTDPSLIPERLKQGIRSYVAYLLIDREGLEENATGAMNAAYSCWADRVDWIEPLPGWDVWGGSPFGIGSGLVI